MPFASYDRNLKNDLDNRKSTSRRGFLPWVAVFSAPRRESGARAERDPMSGIREDNTHRLESASDNDGGDGATEAIRRQPQLKGQNAEGE